jgi:hypothetical protein
MSHHPIPGTDAINFTYADSRKTRLKNWGNKQVAGRRCLTAETKLRRRCLTAETKLRPKIE